MSSNKKISTVVLRRSLLILTPYKYRNRTQDTKYKPECAATSDEVGHVVGHFSDGRVVEVLDVLQRALVRLRHEVDGDTLAPEAAAAPDPGITTRLT